MFLSITHPTEQMQLRNQYTSSHYADKSKVNEAPLKLFMRYYM